MTFPFPITPLNDDEFFMLEALKEAWKAFKKGEVPVGAVLVKNKQVISRGHNQVEMLKDATAHAEMLCITAGEAALDNWRLIDTTLYSTVEPCSMCAGSILLTRIPTLVWGTPDIRHGANGSWVNLFLDTHPTHSVQIRTGILRELCAQLLKDFFIIQRQNKSSKKMELNGKRSYDLE